MTTPTSPLDKKDLNAEAELTLDQRVNRLEHTLENAFNYLGKQISSVDFKLSQESKEVQAEISKTLTLMNMSTLQNIVTLREILKTLIDKEIIDAKAFEASLTEELTRAIEAQQKAILGDQAEEESTLQVDTEATA